MSDYVISDRYDGSLRRLFPVSCESCGTIIYVPAHVKAKRRFCSRTCSSRNQLKRVLVTCSFCGKQFERRDRPSRKSKSGLEFCSRDCKDSAQRLDSPVGLQPSHYTDGNAAYRQRALRYYGAKCCVCGYSESPQMLDVDHIDDDRANNSIKNLCVVCVWCHALKTRNVATHEWNGKVVASSVEDAEGEYIIQSAHGSQRRYLVYGCRCDVCVTAYARTRKKHPSRSARALGP